MAHEATIVLIVTSEIGHMLADKAALPPNVTESDILSFFQTIIDEQEASYSLKHSDINQMKRDITGYFDKVTSDKNKLIAEESAEAAADAVAAAATIAAAAGSWIPLVNFALTAGAVAATATALGLEIASEKLEKTVVAEISGADHSIIALPSFSNIQKYSQAVNANNLFFPRFQLPATVKNYRALFLAIVFMQKKMHKGKCTPDDIKELFINYYNATQADPKLVSKFTALMQELEDASASEAPKIQAKIEAFFKGAPGAVVKGYSGIMLAFAASIAIKKGRAAYAAYQAGLEARPPEIELSELDAEGNPIEESGAPAADLETLSFAEIGVRALGVVAGVATLVFAGLEIAKAVDTDKKLSKAIDDARSSITTYYTALVSKTADGTSADSVDKVVGSYECHVYDGTKYKNNWHYVTVTKVNDTTLKWTNRAGVSWTLSSTSSKRLMDVGSDCPYYHFDDGRSRTRYEHATIVWDGDNVTGIMGPWNELYARA